MKSMAFFATPEDCSRAFYDALAQADIEATMAVWSEEEEICCVHPAALPLYGYAAVRAAWEAIYRNSPRMRIELKDEHWVRTLSVVVQHAVEWIYLGDEATPRGPVFVTNLYIRAPQGWRLLTHHASPLNAGPGAAAGNVILH
jgi:hypothetical protein